MSANMNTRARNNKAQYTKDKKPEPENRQHTKDEKPEPENRQHTKSYNDNIDTSSHEKMERLEYYGTILLRLPKSLYHDITLKAENEGVSVNQYIIYKLAKSDAVIQAEPDD